jgi:hypothetical protein
MKIEGITILNGLTVMVGDHQFAKGEFSMTVKFDSDDDIVEDTDKVSQLVTHFLSIEMNKLFEMTGTPASQEKTSVSEDDELPTNPN